MSLFSEAVRPPNSTAIAQFTPLHLHPKAYALQRMAANLGISAGPAIGGYLADINYFWIFVGDAVSTLAGAVTLIYFFGLSRYSKTMTEEQKLAVEKNVTTNTRSPLLDRKFLAFLGLLLFASIVFFQFFGMYPLYIRDHFGISKPGIGKLYAVNTVLIVVFEMVLIDYIRDMNSMKIIAWGSFLTCLGFGIMPFDSSVWFCVFSMVIITVGEMMSMPICAGWVGQAQRAGKSRDVHGLVHNDVFAGGRDRAHAGRRDLRAGQRSDLVFRDCDRVRGPVWFLCVGEEVES